VHKGDAKYYLVFTGIDKLRAFLSGNRYGLNNAKVVQITGGWQSRCSMASSARSILPGVQEGWFTCLNFYHFSGRRRMA
jgi:hypothetical protein